MEWMKCADRKITSILSAMLVLGFCCIFSVPAHSQVTGATLTGTITDPSGGVVTGATITATNTATGISRDVKSDASGLYTIPNLVPGPYDIKVSATGFSTSAQSIALAVGQQQQLNFSLKVGQTSTTVQVTEAAPQIDLTSSAVSGQVESETVRELPLNGRDWTSLAVLQPGVKPIETQMAFATSARGNRGFGGELTVSGQRSTFNNYRLDGITINDYALAGPGDVVGLVLGVDAIEEFQVLTGGFPAEYGRATGGVVNAITRSGTNQLHGGVYEFLRNSALDSNDYFSRVAGNPKPPFKRNQFGALAGAPVIKDKLFVFADYEGLRQTKGIPFSNQTFTPSARLGIISKCYTGTVNNCGTPSPASCPANTTLLDSGANICVNNYAAALLPLWPQPNASGLNCSTPHVPCTFGGADVDRASFVSAGVQAAPENFGTARIDYKIGNNDTLFGTFLRDQQNLTQPDSFVDVGSVSSTSRTTIAVEESHTFGSSFVNAARVGFNRDHVINLFTPTAINPLAGETSLGSIAGQTVSRLSVRGGITDFFGGTESGSHYLHIWNSYQYYDDAIWTHGNHTVKFGGGAERMLYNEHTFQNPGGRYLFNNAPVAPLPPGLPDYVTFLQGLPTHFEGGLLNVIDQPREFRQTTFGAYVQDDWKVKPNLTLNLGIRYEPTTVLNDAQGRITDLTTITATAPTCGTPFSVSAPPYNLPPQAGTTCGGVGPYYNNPTTKNFEPRIGFAWDPFKTGKTSVRGSFGIYDVDPFAGYFLLQQNQAAPFLIFKSITDASTGPGATFQSVNFAPNSAGVTNGGVLLGNSLSSKLAASTVEGSPRRSYVDEWGLSVQRQLAADMTLTVGYVGTHGLHLITRGDDGNMLGAPGSAFPALTTPYGYLFPNCGTGVAGSPCSPGFAVPAINPEVNPALGIIRYIFWNGSSNYNGLNVNLEKRFSHGLQFQVAYTFSKSLDDTSQTIAGDTFANGINSPIWWLPQVYYGPSDFNVAHTLTINALYALPTPKSWNGVLKEALADWELGGIFSYNSGGVTSPLNTSDSLGLGNGGADPWGPVVQIPGCDPIDHGYANSVAGQPQWINQNCYTLPSLPTSFVNQLTAQNPAYVCNLQAPGVDSKGKPTGPGAPGFIPLAANGNEYCTNLLPFDGLRNSITGPHLLNMDFSVHKVFPIKERFNIQFRAEFFNITNHNNFVPPQPNSGSDSNAGLINPDGSYSGLGFIGTYANPQEPAREMQFALKLNW
jgi:hypothetical protein